MYYYVQRQYVSEGQRQTPANYPYATRAEAEKQYALMVSAMWNNEINVADPTMKVDIESVELGTIEGGKVKREVLVHVKPAPEPEEEVEPEGGEEPAGE